MGDFMHSFLDVYYQLFKQTPGDYQGLADAIEPTILEEINEDGSNAEEILRAVKTMRRYILEQSPIIDDGIEVLFTEYHVFAPMVTPKGHSFDLEMIIDLILRNRGGQIKVRDHKTTGVPNGFWTKNQIRTDIQQPTYIGGLRVLDHDIFGGEVSELCTYNYKNYLSEPLDKLFRWNTAYHSPEWIDACMAWYGQVVDEMIEDETFLRAISKDRCAKCAYESPCMLSLQGQDDEQILQLGFKRKDGWSEHHASSQIREHAGN